MSHINKESKKMFEVTYDPKIFRTLRSHMRWARFVMILALAAGIPWLAYGLIVMPFGMMWSILISSVVFVLMAVAVLVFVKERRDFAPEAENESKARRAYVLVSNWAQRPVGQRQERQSRLERLGFSVDAELVSEGSFDYLLTVRPLDRAGMPDTTLLVQQFVVTTVGYYTLYGTSLTNLLPGLEYTLSHVDTFGDYGVDVTYMLGMSPASGTSESMVTARASGPSD